MGVGAQDVMGRVAASIGDLESVTPEFQPVVDVPNGGVLFALPALLAMGLLKYTEQFFKLPKGYYGLDSLFLLLAFMALIHRIVTLLGSRRMGQVIRSGSYSGSPHVT